MPPQKSLHDFLVAWWWDYQWAMGCQTHLHCLTLDVFGVVNFLFRFYCGLLHDQATQHQQLDILIVSVLSHVPFALLTPSHTHFQLKSFEAQNFTQTFSNSQLLLMPWPCTSLKQWDQKTWQSLYTLNGIQKPPCECYPYFYTTMTVCFRPFLNTYLGELELSPRSSLQIGDIPSLHAQSISLDGSFALHFLHFPTTFSLVLFGLV